MLQCKTCGEVFPGIYVPEESTTDFKATATNADTLHTCSGQHTDEYFGNLLHILIVLVCKRYV
jgi:hypothetical protein